MTLPQIAAIGIYYSKIAAKNTDCSSNRMTTLFEIELPLGNGGISYIDQMSRPIQANTLICAKPGQTRHTKFPFECYYVHMSIPDGPLCRFLEDVPNYIELDDREKYKRIFTSLITYSHSSGANKELMLHSLLLELIYTISEDAVKRHTSRGSVGDEDVCKKAKEYIRMHLTEALDLQTMAKTFSMSPVYFHNIFKASVGITLREYVEMQRINKAIGLLTTTNRSLTQIAYDCGFSSQSYFSYVFKRRMKVTPRKYVAEHYRKYEI